MTICEIKRNSALDRVKAVLDTGTDPGSLLGMQGQVAKSSVPEEKEDDGTEADDYQIDIEEEAKQQIISANQVRVRGSCARRTCGRDHAGRRLHHESVIAGPRRRR